MDKAELAQYFDGQKSIMIMNSATFVDYDQIKNPIRSVKRGSIEVFPHVSYKRQNRILLKINKFSDAT